jgi:hypothetical protein
MASQQWLDEHDRRQNAIRQQNAINQTNFIKQMQAIDRMPLPRQAPFAAVPHAANQPGQFSTGSQTGHPVRVRSEAEIFALSAVPVALGTLAGIAAFATTLVDDGMGQWLTALIAGAMAGFGVHWLLLREPLQILLGAIVFGIIVPTYKAGRWLVRLLTGHRVVKH